jgi:hypothetical protein
MDRKPQPVKDPVGLVRAEPFSLDRVLTHVDPSPADESEAFVRLVYEQRQLDGSADRNHKTRR